MSDLSLTQIQDFVDQFQDPSAIGQSGIGNETLWQGIVTGFDLPTERLTVKIAGKDVPKLKCLQWPPPQNGDVVWGIQEGRIKIVLGVLAPSSISATGVLGAALISQNSNGTCKGRWGDGSGSATPNVPCGSSDTDLKMGLVTVPINPRRMMELRFRIAGVDHIATAYNTITMYLGYNGGSLGVARRSVDYEAAFCNKPRQESFRFITTDVAQTVTLKLYGNTSSGTAYFYRYSTSVEQDHSWIELADIGPAKDFIDQGGVY